MTWWNFVEKLLGVSRIYYLFCLSTVLILFTLEFTEHQRTVFCVFSGDGVNRLRNYLNNDPQALYDTEGTMYDDREMPEGDNEHQVATQMNMTTINDEYDADEDPEMGEGSQYGGEVEGS